MKSDFPYFPFLAKFPQDQGQPRMPSLFWEVSWPPAVLSCVLVICEPQDNPDHVTDIRRKQVANEKGTIVYVLIIHYPLQVPANR